MMRSIAIIAAIICVLSANVISAFTTTAPTSKQSGIVFQPARSVIPSRPPMSTMAAARILALHMSTEGESESNAVSTEPKISADGTFYDDEIDSAPQKAGISDSMRQRLMAEASTGLNSEQKQTNVILYISIGVAVLVVLGGAGIFY